MQHSSQTQELSLVVIEEESTRPIPQRNGIPEEEVKEALRVQ